MKKNHKISLLSGGTMRLEGANTLGTAKPPANPTHHLGRGKNGNGSAGFAPLVDHIEFASAAHITNSIDLAYAKQLVSSFFL